MLLSQACPDQRLSRLFTVPWVGQPPSLDSWSPYFTAATCSVCMPRQFLWFSIYCCLGMEAWWITSVSNAYQVRHQCYYTWQVFSDVAVYPPPNYIWPPPLYRLTIPYRAIMCDLLVCSVQRRIIYHSTPYHNLQHPTKPYHILPQHLRGLLDAHISLLTSLLVYHWFTEVSQDTTECCWVEWIKHI